MLRYNIRMRMQRKEIGGNGVCGQTLTMPDCCRNKPSMLARTILYLASDKAAAVSGEDVPASATESS